MSGSGYALAVLFAINLMNFFDRQLLGGVGEGIRRESALSDTPGLDALLRRGGKNTVTTTDVNAETAEHAEQSFTLRSLRTRRSTILCR